MLTPLLHLEASNGEELDQFGSGMALDGDTLVVGAPRESSAAAGVGGDQADNSAVDSGAVYVFRRTGTTWQQEAYVKASNTGGGILGPDGNFGPGDFFGTSVALLGDTLVVGALFEDSAATGVGGDQADDSAGDSGAVYVFRRTGTVWQQEAYLKPPDTEAGANFGGSLVLADDTLVVGAPSRDPGGAVYVFRRSGSTWALEALLEGTEVGDYDEFGASLALAGDTLAIGAVGRPGDSGAAHVFQRSGSAWAQESYLQAPSPSPDDFFGTSVALAGDTLFAGASGSDGGGTVHVFRRAGTLWQQETEIEPLDGAPSDFFGESLAVLDGVLAVGRSGAVYLFDAQ